MQRKLFRPLAAAALLALAVGAGTAQARDNVFWSLGVEAAPGVSVGVSNARPVLVAPQPVYVAPQPVYVAPRPVVVQPRPVVLVEQPVYVVPGHRGHKHKHRHHGHRHHD
jgi:hypothetical protein